MTEGARLVTLTLPSAVTARETLERRLGERSAHLNAQPSAA